LSTLDARIQADLVAAMKSRDKFRVETLRGLSSDLKYRRIELKADLTDADIEGVLRQAAKKRREAMESYSGGGRQDLYDNEKAELEIIVAYLPPEMSDAEVDAIIQEAMKEVNAAGMKDMGKVMSAVMPKLQGRADGKRVNAQVRSLLQEA